MADFPETNNEKPEEDGFSTVFSDPAAHREITLKPKKTGIKILAGVLALAILVGGTIAVVRLVPVLSDGETSELTSNEITVKSIETDDVVTASVTNSNGAADFYSKTEVLESEGDTSSSTETVKWYVKQVDEALTSSVEIENIVETLASITSTREISEKTAEECGFSEPAVTARVTLKSGEEYTVELGDKSPDNGGYYLRLKPENKIYLVSEDVYTSLQFTLLDLADTTSISGFKNDDGELDAYFEEGSLTGFDRAVLKGEKYPQPIVFEKITDEELSQYFNYSVTSPIKRTAQNVDTFMYLFQSGVTVSGAYSYNTSPADIAKFGLDKPYIEMTMYVANKSITYKFALQEDGDYAVISDNSKMIYRAPVSVISSLADSEPENFYSTSISIVNINDINNFTIKTSEKVYSFDIAKNPDNEDGEEPEQMYDIKIDGKTIVSETFQDFYAEVLGLSIKDFAVESTSEQPEYIIEYSLKDGTKTTVQFKKLTATRYQCELDGEKLGQVTATSLNRIIRLAESTIKDVLK